MNWEPADNAKKVNVDRFEDKEFPELCSREFIVQGPVVQNVVSLTLSLSPPFVNYISTTKANTLLFFVDKM